MKKLVTHLIVGLGKGGAETMLYQVLKYRTDSELTHRVISLGASHYYEQPIRELGVELIELPLKKNPVSALLRLPGLVKGSDTLCCWMYHANLLGYVAGKLAGVKKIVWCIRHSNLDPKLNSAMTLRINRICARWSAKVSAVVYNGNRAREVHEQMGYCRSIGHVVDNGCDCEEYAPNPSAGESLRKELGIAEDQKIVLSLTKDTPIKDVPTFLKAFSALKQTRMDTVAVLCGPGMVDTNENITGLCGKLGLVPGRDIYLLGLRHDVPRLLAGCDLFVLHSAGEAFPNTLLQAMACGCLCVTTDVGDARLILAQDDCVVPPGEAAVLSDKMREIFELTHAQMEQMRVDNRKSAQERFEVSQIIRNYEELFL